jgi:hypothetical protein
LDFWFENIPSGNPAAVHKIVCDNQWRNNHIFKDSIFIVTTVKKPTRVWWQFKLANFVRRRTIEKSFLKAIFSLLFKGQGLLRTKLQLLQGVRMIQLGQLEWQKNEIDWYEKSSVSF